MSTVKPYIITLKTILCYGDPPPTVEQIINELGIDVIEISISEAVVSPKTVWKPLGELLGDPVPAPVAVEVEVAMPVKVAPPAMASTGWLYAKEEAPFDVRRLQPRSRGAEHQDPLSPVQSRCEGQHGRETVRVDRNHAEAELDDSDAAPEQRARRGCRRGSG